MLPRAWKTVDAFALVPEPAPDPTPALPPPAEVVEVAHTPAPAAHEEITLDARIYFTNERARVRVRARPALAEVVRALGRLGDYREIVVRGHADPRGPARFNDWLSAERARRTRDALIALGVPADRIRAEGRGGRGVAGAETDRQVEFVVVREVQGVASGNAGLPPIAEAAFRAHTSAEETHVIATAPGDAPAGFPDLRGRAAHDP